MPTELNLPRLLDLSEDPNERYGELEDHIRRLERRLRRRADHIERSIDKLREEEEIVLKRDGIDYEYFSHEEPGEPRESPSNVVETLAGIVFLYGLDEISFNLLSMNMKEKLDAENDRILEKTNVLLEIGKRYEEFMGDFAVRYAEVTVVGKEDTTSPYGLAHCLDQNNRVTHTYVDAQSGIFEPIHDEEVTHEYMSLENQNKLAERHAGCDHNQYIITHPSDVFDHENLVLASAMIIQKRFFELNPDVKAEVETKQEIARAQEFSSIFSAIGDVTRDPLGVDGDDDDDGMLN